jgi:hypothetical protein
MRWATARARERNLYDGGGRHAHQIVSDSALFFGLELIGEAHGEAVSTLSASDQDVLIVNQTLQSGSLAPYKLGAIAYSVWGAGAAYDRNPRLRVERWNPNLPNAVSSDPPRAAPSPNARNFQNVNFFTYTSWLFR